MLLMTLLAKLRDSLIEESKTIDLAELQGSYDRVAPIFADLADYQLSDDTTVPGVKILDIRRSLVQMRNTYFSAYSGLMDSEINPSHYTRDLQFLAARINEHYQAVEASYRESLIISAALTSTTASKMILPPEIITVDQDLTMVSAASGTSLIEADTKKDQQILDNLANLGQELVKNRDDLWEAEKDVFGPKEPYQLKDQEAPKTTEGWRKLIEKSAPDAMSINTLKKEGNKDEEFVKMVAKYQAPLQKLMSTNLLPGTEWAIGRGPIWFASKPVLRESKVESLYCKHDAMFPGWILDNQYLIGVQPSIVRDRAKIFEIMRFAKEALSQRIESGDIVFMNVPQPKIRAIAEKEQSQGNITKKSLRVIEQQEMQFSMPKFYPLHGGKLVWTWIMPKSEFIKIGPLQVLQFQFPLAPNLRVLEERTQHSILPAIKQERLEGPEKDKQLATIRLRIESECEIATKDLNVEISQINEKTKLAKSTWDDLKADHLKSTQEIDNLKEDRNLAGTQSLKEKIDQSIAEFISNMTLLSGKMDGYANIIKQLKRKQESLEAQKQDIIKNIRDRLIAEFRAGK
jgi:hypothetical protein